MALQADTYIKWLLPHLAKQVHDPHVLTYNQFSSGSLSTYLYMDSYFTYFFC